MSRVIDNSLEKIAINETISFAHRPEVKAEKVDANE